MLSHALHETGQQTDRELGPTTASQPPNADIACVQDENPKFVKSLSVQVVVESSSSESLSVEVQLLSKYGSPGVPGV